MKIKKTVSDKVIAANRKNGKETKGPIDVDAVAQNARKHGLASKRLVFRDEEERREFDALVDDLTDEYQPVGRTGLELIE